MKKILRVLHVFGRLDRGGAETLIMNIYRNVDRKKVQFDFIVHSEHEGEYENEILSMGGIIFRMPRYTGKNHFIYKKEWDSFFINYPEYKIIHSHMRSTASIYLNIAKKYGLKAIMHSHSTSSGNGFTALVKSILQYKLRYISDYKLACSIESGEWLFGKKACKNNNLRIVKNAIDSSQFIFNKSIREKTRADLLLEDKFVVGHIGRLHPLKNHGFLIEIFKEIRKKVDNAYLVLVGNGKIKDDLEALIKHYGLELDVLFTGSRSDIPNLLFAMDVFIFPSFWEGLPLSVVEAQASGLPCIISDKITDDVCITPYVRKVSLKKSAVDWASIATSIEKVDRLKHSNNIIDSGFDIKNVVNDLMKFYFEII